MEPDDRYIIQDSFIQSEKHTGKVWYVFDTLLHEKKEHFYPFEALAKYIIEELNEEWKKEVKKTEWQRNTIFFCYVHYFYEETSEISLDEIVKLHEDERYEIIKKYQNKRAKILFEAHVDIIDGINCGSKILEYNEILLRENKLRKELILNELKEIKTNKDFHGAITEIQKWTKHLIENYNLYYPLFE